MTLPHAAPQKPPHAPVLPPLMPQHPTMHTIPASELLVAETRQRREFDPKSLMELTESIERLGLMHPIVVKDGNHLVAGERRLRAIKDLWETGGILRCGGQEIPEGLIPIVSMGELSPLEAMEAEYEENVRRVDLSWQEHAIATKCLHDLRVAQADAIGKTHRVSDTAREVEGRADGDYLDKTKRSIILANHLDNPNVAGAKDPREAYKILKRAEEAKMNARLASEVGKTFSVADHTLLLGDSIEWMGTLPAASFDVILTDPPYGMGADEFGDAAGRLVGTTHEYKDDEASFKTLLSRAAKGFDRIARGEAHLYCFCDIDKFHWLRALFNESGWTVFRTPLIIHKLGSGRVPLPEHGPRRQYELVLYAFRGGKRTTAIYSDVISAEADDNLGHGAQKPVGVYSDLLKRSARSGDRVIDPFAGTGTIFPAAHGLQVSATGIEQSPAYYGIAVKRLEQLK